MFQRCPKRLVKIFENQRALLYLNIVVAELKILRFIKSIKAVFLHSEVLCSVEIWTIVLAVITRLCKKKKLFSFIRMRVWQYIMMNPSNNFNWIFYLSLDKFIVLYIGQFRQLKYTLLMIPTSIHSKFRMWK